MKAQAAKQDYSEAIKKAYEKLRNYAFYLNKYTPDDAEDLLHDTILKMMDKIDLYTDKNNSLTAWGSAIMHNLHINKLRSQKYFLPEEVLQRVADVKEIDEKIDLLKKCKSKLKDKHLEVFLLRKFGLSYNEIAEFTGTSLGTTKARIHTMKTQLCERS